MYGAPNWIAQISRTVKTIMADGETAKDDAVAASSSQEPKDQEAKIQEDKIVGDVIVESGEPIYAPDQNDDTEMTAADEETTSAVVAVASSSNATDKSSPSLKRPAENDTSNDQGDEAEDAVATLPVDGTTKAPPPPPPPVLVDITKPVKRARTAYFIFADDKRSEVQDKVSSRVLWCQRQFLSEC
jgi:hypothetical protein